MKPKIKALHDITPKGFIIGVLDETEYWRDDIKERAEIIETVYLIDLSKPTCLCSPAINYPAIPLRHFVHKTDSFTEDELTEIERNVENEVTYFTEYSKVKVIKHYNRGLTEDEIIESEAANPSYC